MDLNESQREYFLSLPSARSEIAHSIDFLIDDFVYDPEKNLGDLAEVFLIIMDSEDSQDHQDLQNICSHLKELDLLKSFPSAAAQSYIKCNEDMDYEKIERIANIIPGAKIDEISDEILDLFQASRKRSRHCEQEYMEESAEEIFATNVAYLIQALSEGIEDKSDLIRNVIDAAELAEGVKNSEVMTEIKKLNPNKDLIKQVTDSYICRHVKNEKGKINCLNYVLKAINGDLSIEDSESETSTLIVDEREEERENPSAIIRSADGAKRIRLVLGGGR